MENLLDDLIYDIYDECPSLLVEGGVVARYFTALTEEGTLVAIYKVDGTSIVELIEDLFVEEEEGYILSSQDIWD